MNLYLIQHAEAKPKEEEPDRPLTNKGRRDIGAVMDFIGNHIDVGTGGILHSGKTRARETAEIVADRLGVSNDTQEAEALEPLADPRIWAERLKETDEDLVLVGHLPHLGKLAAQLVCGEPEKEVVKFQQGGVVCLNKEESSGWSLLWMIIPQLVEVGGT